MDTQEQSPFGSITITWRSRCHCAGQGCCMGPIVWDVNECVGVFASRACSVLRMASIVPMLLEGFRLANGRCSFSPSPNLCFAIQIYRHGYNADLWHSWSFCHVLLKQQLLFCALKAWTQRNKAVWKTSPRGEHELHLKLKTQGKQNTSDEKWAFMLLWTHICVLVRTFHPNVHNKSKWPVLAFRSQEGWRRRSEKKKF